jgi:hypothetical protein
MSWIDIFLQTSAMIEFHVAEKESLRIIQKHLCIVYRSVTVNRCTSGHWVRRGTASETRKAEFCVLPQ